MENLALTNVPGSFRDAFRHRRVLVTGHTGFKGAWLSEWLLQLGAEVTGFALPPPTSPALFEQLGLAARMHDVRGDVRDLDALQSVVRDAEPEFVFHLAAQPLVRRSYAEPIETYATNVMGTANVLESIRQAGRACAIVVVTTDKCYENRERTAGYREGDRLGGHDPYSSSKAAAELVIAAYRRSYFSAPDSRVALASARAGNVIGGGDWAVDRIVPDCIRALARNEPIVVRHPTATRPWQHVLESLSGYLWLAASMATQPGRQRPRRVSADSVRCPVGGHHDLCAAFNFGPDKESNRPVAELVEELLRHWPGRWEDRGDPAALHEARLLNLSTDRARTWLGWTPVWGFAETIARTAAWYRQVSVDPEAARKLTLRQLADYTATAQAHKLPWAAPRRLETQAA